MNWWYKNEICKDENKLLETLKELNEKQNLDDLSKMSNDAFEHFTRFLHKIREGHNRKVACCMFAHLIDQIKKLASHFNCGKDLLFKSRGQVNNNFPKECKKQRDKIDCGDVKYPVPGTIGDVENVLTANVFYLDKIVPY